MAFSKPHDDRLRNSYNISLLIAKAGNPNTIRLNLTGSENTVLHNPIPNIVRKILLSNNSVQRIDDMTEEVENLNMNI